MFSRVYVAVKDTLSGSESEVDQSPASAIGKSYRVYQGSGTTYLEMSS